MPIARWATAATRRPSGENATLLKAPQVLIAPARAWPGRSRVSSARRDGGSPARSYSRTRPSRRVLAGGGQGPAVGREGDRRDRELRVVQAARRRRPGTSQRSRLGPPAIASVLPSGANASDATRAELASMRPASRPAGHVPEDHGPVGAARGQGLAVGRERQRPRPTTDGRGAPEAPVGRRRPRARSASAARGRPSARPGRPGSCRRARRPGRARRRSRPAPARSRRACRSACPRASRRPAGIPSRPCRNAPSPAAGRRARRPGPTRRPSRRPAAAARRDGAGSSPDRPRHPPGRGVRMAEPMIVRRTCPARTAPAGSHLDRPQVPQALTRPDLHRLRAVGSSTGSGPRSHSGPAAGGIPGVRRSNEWRAASPGRDSRRDRPGAP